MTMIPIVIAARGTVTKGLEQRLGNKRTSEDHPNYSINKIGQNTEKSSGDLRRIAVSQTLVKNHQLTLMWNTQNSKKITFQNNILNITSIIDSQITELIQYSHVRYHKV